MAGSVFEGLQNVSEVNFLKHLGIGTDDWKAVVANVDITQTNLIGIAILATGTDCVAVSINDEELDLSNFPVGFYKVLPKKFKSGLDATVAALYMVS